jgi:hypothetical protein
MERLTPAVLVLVLAACGGSGAKPADPPAPRAWKDMSTDQRKEYMKEVVMPRAKEVFTAFDPGYADMDCKTCHGRGDDDGTYEMPSAELRPLPNTPEAFMALVEKDADVKRFTPFMVEKVEPMMGELLQMTVFDPKTETGELSCETCHTLVDAAGNVVPPREREGHEHHDHDHHHDHAD